MASGFVKVEYIGRKPIFIPKLTNYRTGIAISANSKNKILEVTEKESIWLLRQKSSLDPMFKIIEEKREKKEKTIEE